MKRAVSVLAILAASFASTTAFAADALIIEPAVIVEDSFDWSGFYAGINGGFGGGTFEHPFAFGLEANPLIDGSVDITAGGFVGGGQVGFTHQFDSFVFGIEADAQWSGVTGEVSGTVATPADVFDFSAGTTVDWFATLRPRIGIASDRVLGYVTGGVAYGQVTSAISFAVDGVEQLPPDASVTNDHWGWTVGGGVEYALTDNLTLKTEYLYTDLGEGELIDAEPFFLDTNVAFHTVRAGLNLRF